jgi:hypothetical protein
VEEEEEDKKPPMKAEYKQFRSCPTNKCAKKLEGLLSTILFCSALVCGFFILLSYFLYLSCPQLVFYEIYSPAKGAEEKEEEDAWDWAKQPPLNSKSILVLLT